MDTLRIALVQTDLYWQDPVSNRAMLEEQLAFLPKKVDVVVLPEMFSTGFTTQPTQYAEVMRQDTTRWLQQMAASLDALLLGSLAMREASAYYNRLLCVQPDGQVHTYDKRHLFRMGGEHEVYTSGAERLLLHWRGWKLCPLICYDLRFPVWSRNRPEDLYDVLLYVANWPAKRSYAWQTLLRARAIENLCYVVGVNRIGTDGNGVMHQGESLALDFVGDVLVDLGQEQGIAIVELKKSDLEHYRERFPALLDADAFDLRVKR